MARYIDANIMQDFLVETNDIDDWCVSQSDNKPDFVEVVRCKDCKRFIEYTDDYKKKVEGVQGDCYWRVVNSVNPQYNAVKYDDFCSYGERKSGV
jgi:hypothetical protein